MGAALCIWSVVCLVFLLYLSNDGCLQEKSFLFCNCPLYMWLTSFLVVLHVRVIESIMSIMFYSCDPRCAMPVSC